MEVFSLPLCAYKRSTSCTPDGEEHGFRCRFFSTTSFQFPRHDTWDCHMPISWGGFGVTYIAVPWSVWVWDHGGIEANPPIGISGGTGKRGSTLLRGRILHPPRDPHKMGTKKSTSHGHNVRKHGEFPDPGKLIAPRISQISFLIITH